MGCGQSLVFIPFIYFPADPDTFDNQVNVDHHCQLRSVAAFDSSTEKSNILPMEDRISSSDQEVVPVLSSDPAFQWLVAFANCPSALIDIFFVCVRGLVFRRTVETNLQRNFSPRKHDDFVLEDRRKQPSYPIAHLVQTTANLREYQCGVSGWQKRGEMGKGKKGRIV